MQQAISMSPTKMYEHQPSALCLSPNRRQANNYLEVSQPIGDNSSMSHLNQDQSNSRMSIGELGVDSRQPSFGMGQTTSEVDTYYQPKKHHEELIG